MTDGFDDYHNFLHRKMCNFFKNIKKIGHDSPKNGIFMWTANSLQCQGHWPLATFIYNIRRRIFVQQWVFQNALAGRKLKLEIRSHMECAGIKKWGEQNRTHEIIKQRQDRLFSLAKIIEVEVSFALFWICSYFMRCGHCSMETEKITLYTIVWMCECTHLYPECPIMYPVFQFYTKKYRFLSHCQCILCVWNVYVSI